ncbi:MAG: hypothetical protein HRU40_03915 [Saprospiraceae bacterium]|nr:hypothetical protein [Saprospiraceae bacterium]
MLFRILFLAFISCSMTIGLLSCASDSGADLEPANPIIGDWYVEQAISRGIVVKGPPEKVKDVSFLSIYSDGTYESRGYIFDIRRGKYTCDTATSILTLDNQATSSGDRLFKYELIEGGKLMLSNTENGQSGTIMIELSSEKPAILQ